MKKRKKGFSFTSVFKKKKEEAIKLNEVKENKTPVIIQNKNEVNEKEEEEEEIKKNIKNKTQPVSQDTSTKQSSQERELERKLKSLQNSLNKQKLKEKNDKLRLDHQKQMESLRMKLEQAKWVNVDQKSLK